MNARLTTIVAALAVAGATTSVNARPAVVDRTVHRALAATGKVNLIVRMKTESNVAENFQEATFSNRGKAITALKEKLETTHAQALAPLANLFLHESTSGLTIRTFWISPVASIRGATLEDVEKIAALPNVLSVREARNYAIPKPKKGAVSTPHVSIKTVQGYEWGVGIINAPKVWADGNIGQGVRVGAIDTGVRATHEAVVKNFGGAYSWFDPEFKTAVPHDDDGHGTHTMGTMAGAKGVGVAPGATWMACRGCRTEECPDQDLLDCAQFMLCPTDTDGKNPDCSKAPRVINNSWYGDQVNDWYTDAVAAWVKAGIVPVFIQGNDGPKCGTVNSPADYASAFTVGGTSITDSLYYYSSKGPTVAGLIKPDISAPGDSVRSSVNVTDTSYDIFSGTSMAAPHVAGAIALLLQSEPTLTVEQVRARLVGTTEQTGLAPTDSICGNTTDNMWPNNQYGYGRLNVFDAYQGKRSTPASTPAPTTPAPTH